MDYSEKSRSCTPKGYSLSILSKRYLKKKFICTYCEHIMKNPYQASCGHRYCKSCIDYIMSTNLMCILCITRIHKAHTDFNVLMKLEKTPVKCPNCKRKCLYKDLDEHITSGCFNDSNVSYNSGTYSATHAACGSVAAIDDLQAQYEILNDKVAKLIETSYDGNFTWRITNISQDIYSHPFYTHHQGYKMCCKIYFNVTHVSVYFVIMKGDYDAILEWPFNKQVKIIWFDQNHSNHKVCNIKSSIRNEVFLKPVNEMNIGVGNSKFISFDELYNTKNGYIKDNVAFVKIIVN